MPFPKDRSTSMRKVTRRKPRGGRSVRYVRRVKGNKHACALCGARLQATHSLRKLSGSAHRPNRKFGGNLCSACSTRVIVTATRVKEGTLKLQGVQIRMLNYVKMLVQKKK